MHQMGYRVQLANKGVVAMVNLSDLYDLDKKEMEDSDSSVEIVVQNFQEMLNAKLAITAELQRVNSQMHLLERETEYLVALLHDIQSGLNALNYHIMTADNSNDRPEIRSQFERAFAAIKLTSSALRDAIEVWEGKRVPESLDDTRN